MDDLVVTPTEARRNFFNLLKIARSGKRKVYVNTKDSWINLVVTEKKVINKPNWDDFFGGLSDKIYKDMKMAKKMVDKVSIKNIKTW